MKKQHTHYVPTSNAQLSVWSGNMKEKFPILGPVLGFDPPFVTKVETAAQNIVTCVTNVEIKRKELDTAIAALRECRKTDVKVIVNAAVMAKRKDTYTTLIGSELGIIGTNQPIDLSVVRPTLKLALYPGYVEVGFLLQGLKGITIYSRIKGTMGWTLLSHDYESPYKDTRPLAEPDKPEIREYIARYFNGREDIGRESDVAVITYAG